MKDIGQLILCGVDGKELQDDQRNYIAQKNIGGIIYFKNNYENIPQISSFSANLKNINLKAPLFISVDQEGGRVVRFRQGFSKLHSFEYLAKNFTPKEVFYYHQNLSWELKQVGINLNFSPCCDVLTNQKNQVIGDRSYGTETKIVGQYVYETVMAMKSQKVMGSAKHFPGHGDTLEDSHFELPIIAKPLDFIKKYLSPFQVAIDSGVETVMMAHLKIPAWDPYYPTSMSENVHNYLKYKMGFKGIIFSDDIEMQALTDHFTLEEMISKILMSGSHMLIVRTFERAQETIEIMEKLLRDKKLDQNLLERKVDKIIRFKKEREKFFV